MAADASQRSRKYNDRREAILNAAAPILDRDGIRGMTVTEIASDVGVATSAISYYFNGKEALASACIRRSIESLQDLIRAALKELSVEARLVALINGHFELCEKIATGELRLATRFDDLKGLDDTPLQEAFVDLFRALRTLFSDPARAPMSKSELHTRTHMLLQTLVFSRMWLANYNVSDYGRLSKIVADILTNGLAGKRYEWNPLPLSDGFDPPQFTPKAAFLEAATRLISEQGYRGASVDRIAAELGVTKGAIYHVIDTKADLVEICFDRTIEVIREAQSASAKLETSGCGQLEACLAHLIAHQLKGDVPLLRYATASLPHKARASVEQQYTRHINSFGLTISQGIADGSIRPVESSVAAQIATTVLMSSTELANWLPSPLSEKATEFLVRALFEGILRPPIN